MLINSVQPASTHLYFLKLTKIQYPESVFARPVFYSLSEIGIQCHFLYAIRERNLSSAYYFLYFLVSKVKIPRLQGLEFGGFHTNKMIIARARFSNRCCVVKRHALKRCASDGGPSNGSFLAGIGLPISSRSFINASRTEIVENTAS